MDNNNFLLKEPKFLNINDNPIDPDLLTPLHATPDHCGMMGNLALKYGFDSEVCKLLVKTGITKRDRILIAASICKSNRHYLYEELLRHGVEAAFVNSNELMHYTYSADDDPNEDIEKMEIKPMQIHVELLTQERDYFRSKCEREETVMHDKDATIASLAQSLASQPRPAARRAHTPSDDKKDADEMRPITEKEYDEYLGAEDDSAPESSEASLMSDLRLCIPDDNERSTFIDSLSTPNTPSELVETLIKPYCERGVMDPTVASGMKLGELINPYTHFTKPVQPRYLRNKVKEYLETFMAMQKHKTEEN